MGAITTRIFRKLRSVFSGNPPDSLEINGDSLKSVSDGSRQRLSLADVKHITVEQSFLGMFGVTIAIRTNDDDRILVKGLDELEANRLKQKVDTACLELQAKTARAALKKSRKRIASAFQALHSDEYLSAFQMNQWLEEFGDLRFLLAIDGSVFKGSERDLAAKECKSALENSSDWRQERNDVWVKKVAKKRKRLLDNIGEHPLTATQREAILRNDNRVLAVAGAGTGKTTTVVGKVKFLLETKWCKAEEILLLSFSKGAVEELRHRIEKECGDTINVRTFHSLGLEIIATANARKPAIFSASASGKLRDVVTRILQESTEDPDEAKRLVRFLAYYYYPERTERDFETAYDFQLHATQNDFKTLKGDEVKSNQEVQIANWFFLHGIDYVYEREFKEQRTGTKDRRLYKPDFYLPEFDIYLEHFGIDRGGKTASWIDSSQYTKDMQWKKSLHHKNKTRFIETFSYQAFEGRLAQVLKSELKRFGVEAIPIPAEAILEHNELRQRLKPIARLFSEALVLFKGERSAIPQIKERLAEGALSPRSKAFVEIFEEVHRRYESMLDEAGEIDFGDMIIEAAKCVDSGIYRSPFKVIVVDEFQDISRGRAWLMNTLLEQKDDSRLLCVGDDWQSVYRFTGSDVSLMTGYEENWTDAVRIDLAESFRFHDRLQAIASQFVTQNPNQLKKEIVCAATRDQPAVHITAQTTSTLLERIAKKDPGASVLVLGRYRHTLDPDGHKSRAVGSLDIQYLTVHGAKGLEADYVIVNEVISGQFGFPSEIADDPIISLFLTEPEEFRNAEERRLFYVALTRARKDVWLRTDVNKPSPFVLELMRSECYGGLFTSELDKETLHHRCPACGGSVVRRENKQSKSVFLACSFSPRCRGTIAGCPKCKQEIPVSRSGRSMCPAEDCDWTADSCPKCEFGYAIEKVGRNGMFWGCSHWPACDWTRSRPRRPVRAKPDMGG